jgi:hypothetical protein
MTLELETEERPHEKFLSYCMQTFLQKIQQQRKQMENLNSSFSHFVHPSAALLKSLGKIIG